MPKDFILFYIFKDIILPSLAFADMRDRYYKSGDGFVMVYSITGTSSLEDVKGRYQSLLDATVRTFYLCKLKYTSKLHF